PGTLVRTPVDGLVPERAHAGRVGARVEERDGLGALLEEGAALLRKATGGVLVWVESLSHVGELWGERPAGESARIDLSLLDRLEDAIGAHAAALADGEIDGLHAAFHTRRRDGADGARVTALVAM